MSAAERRARILIVDDHPPNIHVLAEVLREGYALSFATSGARAVELAPQADLVLLDVEMPELDGFEVCRRLKAAEATRDIPVIFVTALGEVADETRGFDAGGVDYITKPISPAVVRARVRTHLELKENRDLLAELASRDGLTGITNRRGFDGGLQREWRRAARGHEPVTLVLLDVDHFKLFNDRYGHARGDECLRAVGRALGEACRRPGDIAARYGGEEFGLVWPGLDSAGARALLASLWHHVAGLGIEHAASPTAAVVTLSAGAATGPAGPDTGPEQLLERADRLLYAAKRAGRARAFHEGADEDGRHVVGPLDLG